MKIENQVCSLEQAKRLKELGITQESYFSWCGDETQRLWDNGKDGLAVSDWVYVSETIPLNNQEADHREMVPSAKPFAAAYTVAELGAMIQQIGVYTSVNTVLMGWAVHHVNGYKDYELRQPGNLNTYKTEAEARATILIELLEDRKISAEEVNERLKAA